MKKNEVKAIKETEKPLNEAIPHKHEIEKSFKLQSKDVQIKLVQAVEANLVVIESNGTESGKQDTSSGFGNYFTRAMDADIRPTNDQVSLAEVDSNTTPFSTKISHRGREIDQDAEQYQVKIPLIKTELFKMKDMVKKEVYNELSKRFVQIEKHCISLEISIHQKDESFQSNKPWKPPLQPSRNHSVVRQPNAFKSEQPRISKLWFASQVDVKHNLPKPVTPHHFP
nr:hypothetical protein [Tanacetum cinerariifolium]